MAQHLLDGDGFPVGSAQDLRLSFPAYPYGWPLLPHLAHRLAGQFHESTGAVMNVLITLSVGLLAVRLWLEGAGRDIHAGRSWMAAAFAVLAGTLLNTTFVQKVVLTYYADTATAAATAVTGLLAWKLLDALADSEASRARTLAWQIGLTGLVLVNIKQANAILLALILVGSAVVALRERPVSFGRWLRLAPIMVLPAIAIFGLWAYFSATALPSVSAMAFRPLDEWAFDIVWPVVQRMALVASNKGGYFGLMAVAVGIGFWGLIRPGGSLRRLAVVVAVVFVGYNAFLLCAYLGVFGRYDALRAASYWRYNLHLGLLATLFGAFAAGMLCRRLPAQRSWGRPAGILVIISVLVAPVAFAEKLRFDMEQPKPYYRSVGRDLRAMVPNGASLLVLDPKGTGESMGLTRFELGDRVREITYMAAFHQFDVATVQRMIDAQPEADVLVHSDAPVLNEVFGLPFAADRSYLIRRDGNADPPTWRVLHAWPHPEGEGAS